MIGIGIFGNSNSGLCLSKILTDLNDEKITHWICSTITKFHQGIMALKFVEHKWRKTFLSMLKIKYFTLVENRGLPEKVRSFTLNVMTTHYRIALADILL